MQVIPAIDIRSGRCVRLLQGDFERETVFGDDPVAMASRWLASGAERLHIVDLAGAKTGQPQNLEMVQAIVAAVRPVPCQFGGGVRSDEAASRLLEVCGLERIVVGTKAVDEPEWFERLAARYPGRICLGLDARAGVVVAEGWQRASGVEALELARRFDHLPLAAIIYTDTARDGIMQGPNLTATAELVQSVRTPVVASGGVSCIDDIVALARIGVSGCIVGRALYEGKIELSEAIEAAARASRT
jgi:phosphoribosylformimino-5-aminoimidazole carboxamide ribotide isomerase